MQAVDSIKHKDFVHPQSLISHQSAAKKGISKRQTHCEFFFPVKYLYDTNLPYI